ncbi:MAG: sigma-54-dependent Fis family transcriptional regulator [Candidatus Latescibacteria bacterium]|jgi:two-component system, NtrC family, response regulator AtoC|nr:sigma-54-dependent Fis family transcriptional regulator [Candidatus Latescibacterota bacterium]
MKSRKGRILIVDDDEDIRLSLGDWLEANNYEVIHAANGREGLARIHEVSPDLVILDLQMPEMNGIEVLHQIEKEGLDVTAILSTGFGNVDRAVEAMKAGAFDFVPKDYESDQLKVVIDKAMERVRLKRENSFLRDEASGEAPNIVGHSDGMAAVLNLADRAATTSATVLLLGPSGSGKELIARRIHGNSDRKNRPFIPVNCTALPETLIESELFGHEKNAFTGADKMKLGKFELAHGGTILLDEIGATEKSFQVKLLRVLEDGEINRIGSETPISTDVRIIAATNRDLELEIEEGRFLEDLYFRLNVFPIELPSLQNRREDIPDLAAYFLSKYAIEFGRDISSISEAAMASLMDYEWRGNVRELQNAIERAVLICDETHIRPKDLPAQIVGRRASAQPQNRKSSSASGFIGDLLQENGETEAETNVLDDLEELAVRTALKQSGGKVSKAAALLGLPPTQRKRIERLRDKYEIDTFGD